MPLTWSIFLYGCGEKSVWAQVRMRCVFQFVPTLVFCDIRKKVHVSWVCMDWHFVHLDVTSYVFFFFTIRRMQGTVVAEIEWKHLACFVLGSVAWTGCFSQKKAWLIRIAYFTITGGTKHWISTTIWNILIQSLICLLVRQLSSLRCWRLFTVCFCIEEY